MNAKTYSIMKTKTWLALLLCAVCVLCTGSLSAQDKKSAAPKSASVFFYVEGLNCVNCQATIEKNISFEKGVTKLVCDLPSKMVAVTYNPQKTNVQKLMKAFARIKMPAKEVAMPAQKK